MASRRIERIKSLLQEEIAVIINTELKDPRLKGMISVTKVELQEDLKKAIVYVSVFDLNNLNEERIKDIKALNNASKYIEFLLLKRLDLKHIPKLKFKIDTTMEKTAKVLNIINSVK